MAYSRFTAVGLSLVLASLLPTSQAAQIPEGTKLHSVQELVRGNGSEPASLDPQKVEGTTGSAITKDLFEGLVQQDEFGNIIPAQATHWEVSGGNKVFTFYLRDGIKWSNGDPVTAHDFVFGFRRAVDPETASRYAWYLEIATVTNADQIVLGKASPETLGVEAVDDKTFRVTLEKPVPYFVRMLAHQNTFPAPKKVIEALGDKWTRPGNMVSNGAYVLEDWVVNEKIIAKRNPLYWDNEKTAIEKVTYLALPANTELARYKAGEVDMTLTIPMEHFKSLKKQIPEQIKISPYLSVYYYEFNTKVPPFDDWRVRKALSLAVNREAMTKYVTGMGQKPAYGFTPDSVAGFVPPVLDYATWTQEERDAEAIRLMKEAGYGIGKDDNGNKLKRLNVNLLYNTAESHKKIAIVVAQLWKPLGVQVQLENQEWKTFLDTRNQGRFEVARAGWSGDYNEASTMLDIMLSTHGQNKGRWENAEFDDVMTRSRLLESDEERSKLYTRAEEIIAAEAPVLPVYQSVMAVLVKPYVVGYPIDNVENTIYTKNLFIKAH
ncbi:peptide ABC transporter substrate-binding protein [Ferrimonas lipolytica]|uniref:Peptide ABC transporter substrate-binding protein n=1 Tax=Ferrimonas lipolytica TaxID=2724191 RepID=A0A6H1UJ15_9GAMM|nr:peptide ABC transporter substrate-binding protein [Ferrimonas lipolytica]QIZ77792.1 peptide ABC transporter substrate-binding protein [Ferrimonas lipolytica]